MVRIVPLLGLAAFVAVWHWMLHRRTRGRSGSPLWGAFTATAVSILFMVAGAVGYELTNGVPFTLSTGWRGRVLWPEIWMGLGSAAIAVYFWRIGLRSIRESSDGGS